MEIEIHTHDNKIVFDLLGKSRISVDDEVEIEGGFRIKYSGGFIRKSFGFPSIENFVVTFSSGVTAGLVANWLFNKLKDKRVEKLLIERIEVKVDEGEIKSVLTEKITYQK